MMYGANPTSSPAVHAAMQDGHLAYIDTPAQGNKRPEGVVWMADNGCFSDKWDERKWTKFLRQNARHAETCLFAVAPDVVGDAAATYERSLPYLPWIRSLGYPAAFVLQDGATDDLIPWDDFDVLFIGGSTEYKLSPAAVRFAHEAKTRGKRVHCGRVNSERRWRFAAAPYPFGLGADSCDGTFLTFGPDVNLPRLLAWTRNNEQEGLFT